MIALRAEPFSPWTLLAEHATASPGEGQSGATAVFIGTMRDFNQGDDVRELFLEHYPGMTEQRLEQLVASALEQWPLHDALVVHRVGRVTPADTIVVVAAWSAHREPAFAACRFLIEELKHSAPFWKRETLASGEQRWVEPMAPSA